MEDVTIGLYLTTLLKMAITFYYRFTMLFRGTQVKSRCLCYSSASLNSYV